MLCRPKIYLSQDDEIIEPSFVEVAPSIQETLDTHYVKRSFYPNGVFFQNFIDDRNIVNLFMFNIILEQALLCAIVQVQKATKMSVFFVRNFIMKMKRGVSVLLERCGSMKKFFKQ